MIVQAAPYLAIAGSFRCIWRLDLPHLICHICPPLLQAEAELAEIDVPDNERGVFSFVCFRTRSVAHFAQQVTTTTSVALPIPAHPCTPIPARLFLPRRRCL